MTRFTLLAAVSFALLVPAVAGAQANFTYRPELRGWIPNPPAVSGTMTPRTPAETITRHEAMAHAYRGTRMAQAAVHCDRMVREAREELRRQF